MSGGTVSKREYGTGGIHVKEKATLNFSGSAIVETGKAIGTDYVYNIYIRNGATFNHNGGDIYKSGDGIGRGCNLWEE